jgi:hypothetical protein
MDNKKGLDPTPDANRDPITKEPGAHPFGVAGGSAGGAATGAAIGAAIGGPVGALAGGAIGAVAGGYAGKAAGEAVNPTEEDAYWNKEHSKRPYFKSDRDYSFYQPAYRHGWESASNPTYANRRFEEIEPDLEKSWSANPKTSNSNWRDVRDAARDSFDRVRTRMGQPRDYETKKPL